MPTIHRKRPQDITSSLPATIITTLSHASQQETKPESPISPVIHCSNIKQSGFSPRFSSIGCQHCHFNCTTRPRISLHAGLQGETRCAAPFGMSKDNSLQNARAALYTIPAREPFEVPGKADVLFELRDYSLDPQLGAETARAEIPFLFKPFEVGQKPPPSKGHEPPFREPTIHEYLDWTVTATTLDSLVCPLAQFREGGVLTLRTFRDFEF